MKPIPQSTSHQCDAIRRQYAQHADIERPWMDEMTSQAGWRSQDFSGLADAQATLSNVVADAEAHPVRITLAARRISVTMKFEDDNKGFNWERNLRTPSNSSGLRALQDGIELLGGAIQFTSRPSRR